MLSFVNTISEHHLLIAVSLSILLVIFVITSIDFSLTMLGLKKMSSLEMTIFMIVSLFLMFVSLFSLKSNGWYVIIPWGITLAILIGGMFLTGEETRDHLKQDLMDYEMSKGGNPKIVKEDWSHIYIESDNKKIHVRLWTDSVPVKIDDYDDQTYFYGLYWVRALVIVGPEIIKKYDGKLPGVIDTKEGVKEEMIPWKPSSLWESIVLNMSYIGGFITNPLLILTFYSTICLIIRSLIRMG